jgi:hypothetical protein
MPAQCKPGQLFLKTNTPGGATLYACTAADTWKPQGLTTSSATPGDQDVLRWNAPAGQWEPGLGSNSYTAGLGISIDGTALAVEDSVVPEYYAGTGPPGISCVTGRDFYVDTSAGALYFCKAAGQWQPVLSNSQANTYTAGRRQSMSHDGVNAGLRLTPADGDPSGSLDGDIWYNATTGKFRKRQNGAVADWDVAGGNVSTATALAATPSQCSSGQYATGIAASGNANCSTVAYTQVSGRPTVPSVTVTTSVLKGDGAGNASAAAAGTDYQPPPAVLVTSGTTPTCDLGVASNVTRCEQTLGANVTAAFAHLKAGAKFSWAWTQNGSGNFSVTYSGAAANTCAVSPAANVTTVQQFEVASNGTTVTGTGCFTTETAVVYRGPTAGTPPAPASGLVCWADAAAQNWLCRNSAGAIYSATLGIASDPGDHKAVSYVDQYGVQHRAQLASTDLGDGPSIQHDTEPVRLQFTAGSGGVTANTLCKLATDGSVVPIAGTEGILGICQNTAAAGAAVKVAIAGTATCIAEGTIQSNHYVVAGSVNPERCRDSGQTLRSAMALSLNIAGKAACTTGTCAADGQPVTVNLLGPLVSGTLTTGNGNYAVTSTSAPADGCAVYASGNLGSTGSPCGTGGTGAVNADTIATAIYCSDTSNSANSIVCGTGTAFPGAYSTGQAVMVRVANANTGATTINIAGLGPKNVTKNGAVPLGGGDLAAGGMYLLTYDGTRFVAQIGAAATGAHASTHSLGGSDPVSLDANQITSGTLAPAQLSSSARVRSFGVTMDGGGNVLTAGVAGYITIPYACVINGWSVQADQSGSVAVDVWKAAGGIPSGANKISGSSGPSLSGAQLAQSSSLTGWTTSISPNDVVAFSVAGATSVTRATVVVNCMI